MALSETGQKVRRNPICQKSGDLERAAQGGQLGLPLWGAEGLTTPKTSPPLPAAAPCLLSHMPRPRNASPFTAKISPPRSDGAKTHPSLWLPRSLHTTCGVHGVAGVDTDEVRASLVPLVAASRMPDAVTKKKKNTKNTNQTKKKPPFAALRDGRAVTICSSPMNLSIGETPKLKNANHIWRYVKPHQVVCETAL